MANKLGVPFGRRWGVRARVNNRVAITNAGTIEAPATMTLLGPLTDPVITLTYGAGADRKLVFDGEIAAGDELVVSTQDRTVMLGTSSRRSLLVTAESQWFHLPAGDSTISLSAAASGSGAGLRVTWRDAYR